jgi:hypothetical protein
MNATLNVWKSLGRNKAHPADVLNTLIEVDNHKGQIGLWALENQIRQQMPRLRPSAQCLAQAWLEAIAAYRATHYPEGPLSKLFSRFTRTQAEQTELLPLVS